ncbi:MAG: 3-deoxy-manno-octulosonate cytidylyltransferase, partial [Gammaproteobacteria bacterium]
MPADFIVVIPTRYASVRLPGKPLVDIGGRPMIVLVYELACQSGASEVVIATDDKRVEKACAHVGAHVELTGDHASG